MDPQSGLRVYSGPVLATVTHLKNVLDMNGIDCEVRGEFRAAGLGDIPFVEAWPELWVLDPANRHNAERLIREALSGEEPSQSEWQCPKCHEMVEGQFAECWNCGTRVPDQALT